MSAALVVVALAVVALLAVSAALGAVVDQWHHQRLLRRRAAYICAGLDREARAWRDLADAMAAAEADPRAADGNVSTWARLVREHLRTLELRSGRQGREQ